MKIKINLGGQPVTLTVPEGMDPATYADQVEEKFLAQDQYSAASDSNLENFNAGVGQGAVNIGRQVGNIIGLVDDETINKYKDIDKDLLDTKAGIAGSMVGELLATAPVGVGAGALGSRAAQAAGKGGGVLAKALAHPAGVAALDNAATGFIAAGPDNRMEGAVKGAAISGVMSGGGKLLKRTLMQPWVTKTADALDLESMTGHSIPLSQSAEPGIWKQIYEGVVANIPGAGGGLRKQRDRAVQDFRNFVVEEATPPSVGRLSSLDSGDMQKIMGELRDVWDSTYSSFTIKDYPIRFDLDVPKSIRRRMPEGMRIPNKGDVVMAKDLMEIRNVIYPVLKELPEKEIKIADSLRKLRDDIWANIKADIDPTGKGRTPGGKELAEWERLNPYYEKFKDVEMAANKALSKSSEFTPEQLALATAERAGAKGMSGGGNYAEVARKASGALKEFPSRQGIFQTAAAMGMAGAALGGAAVGGPVGAGLAVLAPIAVGKTLANPKVQRVIAGETAGQKVLAKALRSQEKNAKRVARVLGKAATLNAAED